MSWTQTYTGKRFYPNAPRTDDVDIVDIARALSMQCRFNGHIKRFYSVAEHSVLVSRIVEERYSAAAKGRWPYDRDDPWGRAKCANIVLKALLHDASEAYLGDMVRPVKMLPELEDFRRIDSDVQIVIEAAFVDEVPDWADDLIKGADNDILGSEAEWLLVDGPLPYWTAPPPDPKIMPAMLTECSPKEAERLFHARFDELTRRIEGR
jgi:hypothetical protein